MWPVWVWEEVASVVWQQAGWQEVAGWQEAEVVGLEEEVGWQEEVGWEEEVHLEGCSTSTSGLCCTVPHKAALHFSYLVLPKGLVLHAPSVLIKPQVLPKAPKLLKPWVLLKRLVPPKIPAVVKHLVLPEHPVLRRRLVLTKDPLPPACLTVSLRLLLPPGLTLPRLVMARARTSLLFWLTLLRLRAMMVSVMCMQVDDAAAMVPDVRCMGVAEVLRGCCGCCTHRASVVPGRVRGCVSNIAAAAASQLGRRRGAGVLSG